MNKMTSGQAEGQVDDSQTPVLEQMKNSEQQFSAGVLDQPKEQPASVLNQTEQPASVLSQTEQPVSVLNQVGQPVSVLNQATQPTAVLDQVQSQPQPVSVLNQGASQSVMGQNVMGQQSVGQPVMGQNVMGQQMAPVMQSAPRKPMSPKMKKNIIIGSVVGTVVVAAGIAAAIIVPIMLRVNYSEVYRASKDLGGKISKIDIDDNCSNVTAYYKNDYISVERYSEYTEGCRAVMVGVDQLVKKVEGSQAVKKDKDIKEEFGRMKEAMKVFEFNEGELEKKLDLYKAWHKWEVLADDISYNSSEAEIDAAAESLISSSDEKMKEYGEGWAKLSKEKIKAYINYRKASIFDKDYSEKRKLYDTASSKLTDWNNTKKVDLRRVAPLNFEDKKKAVTAYNNFHDLVRKTYERNYDEASKDCTYILGKASCQ